MLRWDEHVKDTAWTLRCKFSSGSVGIWVDREAARRLGRQMEHRLRTMQRTMNGRKHETSYREERGSIEKSTAIST